MTIGPVYRKGFLRLAQWAALLCALGQITTSSSAAETSTKPTAPATMPGAPPAAVPTALPSAMPTALRGHVEAAQPYDGRIPSVLTTQPSDPPRPFTRPATAPASRPTATTGSRLATKPAAPAGDLPNIILIMSSDQSAGMTGFEGHPLVKTPNLDRLAREGLYLSRCYTPTPMSAPTRASVLTGQYPHAHGVTNDGSPLSPRVDTFTAGLKQAGYACGIVGKWQLPDTNAREPGFGMTDFVATDDRDWKWDQCPVWVNGERKTADKFLTDWQGDRAVEFIEEFKDRPFFLWLCFRSQQPQPPQDQLSYPPGTEQLYPPASIDIPSTNKDPRAGMPQESLKSSKAVTSPVPKNDALLREARSKYCAMLTRMDENIGRLLRRLDELQLTDKTMIVFTSDGGFALGEHGLFGKGPFFYEAMIRCPLVVRYPRWVRPGGKCDRVVSLVDLAPTFCELAGQRPPLTAQGQSLLSLWRHPDTANVVDERFLEYDSSVPSPVLVRGVVTSRYKFIRYVREGHDVLFDLKLDADELINVGKEPLLTQQYFQYKGAVKTFQNRLDRWRKVTRDPVK